MSSTATLEEFPWVVPITTRWTDNDIYGHVNNAVYYSYFDSAANLYLIREGGLDPAIDPVIALVVESKCTYHRPIAYPDAVHAGVRVDRLGQRSVTWGIAIFTAATPKQAPVAAATGTFVHVFVDRGTRKSVAIPAAIRGALEAIVRPEG